MPAREFDLNIERVLENWTVAPRHPRVDRQRARRGGPDRHRRARDSARTPGPLALRDFGRGLRYEHLTQNENREKLASPEEGRRQVRRRAQGRPRDVRPARASAFGSGRASATSRLPKQAKHGFGDVTTLHAVIAEPSDPAMVGTDVELSGVAVEDVKAAKSLFRHYAGDEAPEETEYGVVLARPKFAARIYVNGLRVAEERELPLQL